MWKNIKDGKRKEGGKKNHKQRKKEKEKGKKGECVDGKKEGEKQ